MEVCSSLPPGPAGVETRRLLHRPGPPERLAQPGAGLLRRQLPIPPPWEGRSAPRCWPGLLLRRRQFLRSAEERVVAERGQLDFSWITIGACEKAERAPPRLVAHRPELIVISVTEDQRL